MGSEPETEIDHRVYHLEISPLQTFRNVAVIVGGQLAGGAKKVNPDQPGSPPPDRFVLTVKLQGFQPTRQLTRRTCTWCF
jgi:hypothetical protein